MKNLFLIVLLFLTLTSNAQKRIVEAKVNPIGLLWGRYSVSAEFFKNDNFGIDIAPAATFANIGRWFGLGSDDGDYKVQGFSIQGAGKYYFNPKYGCDRFGVGMYTIFSSNHYKSKYYDSWSGFQDEEHYVNTRFAIGFLGTYKWVSKAGVVFEVSTGFGRAFINRFKDKIDSSNNNADQDLGLPAWDSTGRLAIGYRFGGKKDTK